MNVKRMYAVTAIVAVSTLAAATARAAATDEQKCQAKLQSAAAKYAACQTKAKAKFEAAGEDLVVYNAAAAKCVAKYAAVWPKVQTKFAGTSTTCDGSRFDDIGQAILDNLTGLQWEEKYDDNTINDKDLTYAWTSGFSRPDGPAFTTHLRTFNTGSCFASSCDWRLPSRIELQGLLMQPYPCTTSPCTEAGLGLTMPGKYFTADEVHSSVSEVWAVDFADGSLKRDFKLSHNYVRAVRAGR